MVSRGFTVAVEHPHSARSEAIVGFSCGREDGAVGGRWEEEEVGMREEKGGRKKEKEEKRREREDD